LGALYVRWFAGLSVLREFVCWIECLTWAGLLDWVSWFAALSVCIGMCWFAGVNRFAGLTVYKFAGLCLVWVGFALVGVGFAELSV
jgi:hypothetical protein